MNVFVVLAHPEHHSFNAAMFRTAVDVLTGQGMTSAAFDLHAMQFDPVSGRHNFITVKDPNYFKQQIEASIPRGTGRRIAWMSPLIPLLT
jgi:NAD(P)H dehydrogenase (quinone)